MILWLSVRIRKERIHHRRFTRINKRGNRYGETYQYPSKKAMKKMKQSIKETINQRYLLAKEEEDLIKEINLKIIGWRNYYRTKTDGKWLKAIDWYLLCSFTRWSNKKHQQKRKLKDLYKTKLRLKKKGLQSMTAWRNAVERRMSESRMRENLTYGLMRGKRAYALWPTLQFLAKRVIL